MKYFGLICFGCFLASVKTDTKQPANVVPKIFGGQIAKVAQFPYQVSIHAYNQHSCGGSIISDRFVLTAAHCAFYRIEIFSLLLGYWQHRKEIMQICAGFVSLRSCNYFYEIEQIIIHPHFSHADAVHDIALLKTIEPFRFNKRIRPIRLLEKKVSNYTAVTVSGWGVINNNKESTNELLYVNLYTMESNQCEDFYGTASKFYICLAKLPSTGSCFGDSGGPAVVNKKLAGIASFVQGGCGSLEYPDVFTNVSAHIDWIKTYAGL